MADLETLKKSLNDSQTALIDLLVEHGPQTVKSACRHVYSSWRSLEDVNEPHPAAIGKLLKSICSPLHDMGLICIEGFDKDQPGAAQIALAVEVAELYPSQERREAESSQPAAAGISDFCVRWLVQFCTPGELFVLFRRCFEELGLGGCQSLRDLLLSRCDQLDTAEMRGRRWFRGVVKTNYEKQAARSRIGQNGRGGSRR